MIPPSAIQVLHLTDPHFTSSDSGAELVESLRRTAGLVELPIDAIAVTGDLCDKGRHEGFAVARDTFEGVREIWKLPRDRVLFVPGNHDLAVAEAQSFDWARYLEFASQWYRGTSSVTSTRVGGLMDGGGADYAGFVVDHRESLGVVWLLFNAYAGLSEVLGTSGLDASVAARAKEIGAIGDGQLRAFSWTLESLGVTPRDPKVALIHHHLFPVPAAPGAKADLLRSNILVDAPNVIGWLGRQSVVCVLNGHRHRPFFASHSIKSVPGEVAVAETKVILENVFDRPTEVVVTGGGSCGLTSLEKTAGLPQYLQILRITPRAVPELNVQVELAPWYRTAFTWKNSLTPKRQVVASNATLSELQRRLYEGECFFTSELSVDASDPLFDRVPADGDALFGKAGEATFWRHFVDARNVAGFGELDVISSNPGRWEALGPTISSTMAANAPLPRDEKELLIARLVRQIQHENRKHSIFEIRPSQLAGLYELANLIFDDRAVEEHAEREFSSAEWRYQIGLNLRASVDAPVKFRNHIERANDEIASGVRDVLVPCLRMEGRKRLRLLDLGFGATVTLKKIFEELLEDEWVPKCRVEYLGVDINEALVADARAWEAEQTYAWINGVRPVEGASNQRFVLGSAYGQLVQNRFLKDQRGTYDCVVAAYSMHHTSSGATVSRSLKNGTAFRLLGLESYQNAAKGKLGVLSAIREGRLLSQMRSGEKAAELIDQLLLMRDKGWSGRLGGAEGVGAHPAYRRHLEELCALLGDRQRELYEEIFELLRPGGVLCVADPNGFSKTFNRQQVIWDWPVCNSHFREWTEVVRVLVEVGFSVVRVVRQLRKKDLSVVQMPVDPTAVKLAETGEVGGEMKRRVFELWPSNREGDTQQLHPLEVEDQHLGYVLLAQKRTR